MNPIGRVFSEDFFPTQCVGQCLSSVLESRSDYRRLGASMIVAYLWVSLEGHALHPNCRQKWLFADYIWLTKAGRSGIPCLVFCRLYTFMHSSGIASPESTDRVP